MDAIAEHQRKAALLADETARIQAEEQAKQAAGNVAPSIIVETPTSLATGEGDTSTGAVESSAHPSSTDMASVPAAEGELKEERENKAGQGDGAEAVDSGEAAAPTGNPDHAVDAPAADPSTEGAVAEHAAAEGEAKSEGDPVVDVAGGQGAETVAEEGTHTTAAEGTHAAIEEEPTVAQVGWREDK